MMYRITKNSNYIRYLNKEIGDVLTSMVITIVNTGQLKTLQTLLNTRGASLVEDGIMGYNTMLAIILHKGELRILIDDLLEVKKDVTDKDKAIIVLEQFLIDNEGIAIHYLRGEKGFTTPYGIYSVANPKSKPVIYCKKLFKKYGLYHNSRKDAYKLDDLITTEERNKLRRLAMEFYIPNYLGKMFDIFISSPNSLITYFSNSVNTGKARANKLLQRALNIKADGKIGKESILKVNEYLTNYSDELLADAMLNEVASFYCRLITNNRRYGRFKRGWLNRIKSIGYKGKTLCQI